MTVRPIASLLLLVGFAWASPAAAGPDALLGDWSLKTEAGNPGWLSLAIVDDQPQAAIRFLYGSLAPITDITVSGDRVSFPMRPLRRIGATASTVTIGMDGDGLDGTITHTLKDGSTQVVSFTGTKVPPLPPKPDLAAVRFGHPISLFNGRDLTGWTPHEPDKINGWSVIDGTLANSTPKTDFSATGDHANLKTTDTFEDFWLHIEFLVGEQRNSGVYLRGMYEAQVVDAGNTKMQGIQGVGAIFGLIEPSMEAGRPGGQWQTYDLTLVDRHITVVLNGQTVINNQPLTAPTSGAILTDPTQPGPIYLQGDHTEVRYRDIYLAPVIDD